MCGMFCAIHSSFFNDFRKVATGNTKLNSWFLDNWTVLFLFLRSYVPEGNISGNPYAGHDAWRRTRCMALTNCFPRPYNFLTICYMPRTDSKMPGGAVLGLLLFAYHPYNFLTICYMPRVDRKLRGEPFWGCCCLHTLSLPLASHVLTISSPFATCPESTANCEGSRSGVAAVVV